MNQGAEHPKDTLERWAKELKGRGVAADISTEGDILSITSTTGKYTRIVVGESKKADKPFSFGSYDSKNKFYEEPAQAPKSAEEVEAALHGVEA